MSNTGIEFGLAEGGSHVIWLTFQINGDHARNMGYVSCQFATSSPILPLECLSEFIAFVEEYSKLDKGSLTPIAWGIVENTPIMPVQSEGSEA